MEADEKRGDFVAFVSPLQLGEHFVTLSLLPHSRWKNLLNLEAIKARNKPWMDAAARPKEAAPFFLPTVRETIFVRQCS